MIATLARACERSTEDRDRALRSMTAELPGPTEPGPASIEVETLRAGNAVTTVAARLVQKGEVRAHAVAVLGRKRIEAPPRSEAAPTATPFDRIEPLPSDAPFYPTFAKYYEFRNVGPLPFMGGSEPVASGWVRPRNPGPSRDAAWVIGCADGYWPASFTAEHGPRPMATIAFTIDLLADVGALPLEEPLLHVGRVKAASEGYVVEDRELWTAAGVLVALNRQTFVVIR